METCKLQDFLKVFEQWLDGDYIRKVLLTKEDHLVFTEQEQTITKKKR